VSEVKKGVYKCIYCEKCFSTKEFSIKHIAKKHSSEKKNDFNKIISKMIFKNYMNDEKKIIVFSQQSNQIDMPHLEMNQGRLGIKNE
jgi:hypothetical protein